jgi:serine/threonine protein kinase
MSPELLGGSPPTKQSDCYALGMVIYEVLSGKVPFVLNASLVSKILRGEHPERPQGEEGALFTDEIWEVLEQCWEKQPADRISAEGVFIRLRGRWIDVMVRSVKRLFAFRQIR